jgi:hypothetical protein
MTNLMNSFRQGLRSERGITIPMALMVIIIGLGLAGAAVMATVASQRGSVGDEDRKTAIGAADAGISQALYRENRIPTTSGLRCLVQGGSGLVAGAPLSDGWCPERDGAVGDASFVYRVQPWEVVTVNQREMRRVRVVSIGTSDDVSRRVAVTALAPTGDNLLGNDGAVGVDSVHISGVSVVNASTGSNGTVTLENNGTLCGNARHGPAGNFAIDNNGVQCPGYGQSTALTDLPPPDLTEAKANDATWKFFSVNTKTGNATWNASTRTLELQGGAVVNMTSGDYVLCRLKMTGGSQLIVPAGEKVRIWFDKPENCGWTTQDSPVEQIKVDGTSSIISSGYDPLDGSTLMNMYVAGSDVGIDTEANFGGNGSALYQVFLYAPRTDVTITGNVTYQGPVAGKTLLTDGNATLTSDPAILLPHIDIVVLYRPDRYVECTGATGSPPDANC